MTGAGCDRRDLLGRGLGVGGAVVAASAIPLLLAVRDAFAQSETDGTLLEKAITLERVTVLAYDRIIERDLLSARVARAARELRAHEQEHARVLETALTDLGGTPPPAPEGPAAVGDVVKGLDDITDEAGALAFLIELERAGVAAYHDAQSKLVEARLLQTAASIMGAEGQHLVVLRQAAGRSPVPEALETGAK